MATIAAFSPERMTCIGQIDHAAELAASGAIQLTLLIASLLSITYLTVRSMLRNEQNYTKNKPLAQAPVIFEILSHMSRIGAVVFSFISTTASNTTDWKENILLTYLLLLGLARITVIRSDSPWRTGLRNHINFLLAGCLLLNIIANIAPLLIIHTSFIPAEAEIAKIGCLSACIAVALVTPRQWCPPPVNFNLAHRGEEDASSPEETCSLWSFYLYGWMTYIIKKGYRGQIKLADMLPLPHYDEPLVWFEKLMEARERWKSSLRTLVYMLRYDIADMALCSLFTAVAGFIAPVAMFHLLHYLQNPDDESIVVQPLFWVILLLLGPVCRSLAYQQYFAASTKLAVRLKVSIIQEIYQTCLRSIPTYAFDADDAQRPENMGLEREPVTRNAQILSLISADVDSICLCRDFVQMAIQVPVTLVIGGIFLHSQLGWASFTGMTMILLVIPFTSVAMKRLTKWAKPVAKASDARLSLLTQYLSSIKTLKYLAWETAAKRNIETARNEHERLIWKRQLWSMLANFVVEVVPHVALFVMFLTFVLSSRNQVLTSAVAFPCLAVLDILRRETSSLAKVAPWIADAITSLRRLDAYLEDAIPCSARSPGAFRFDNAVFRRTPLAKFPIRSDALFLKHELNIVVGPAACGKSTLLLGLLGEVDFESGGISGPEDVAYVPQNVWLMNDTVRNNIVFFSVFDQVRYINVIALCELDRDLEYWPEGDLKQAGENGDLLSGGQRQRIALARALYANASCLLLDDVLSAVDRITSLDIWKRFFHQGSLRNPTVVLTTGDQRFQKDADMLITMERGKVVGMKRQWPKRAGNPWVPRGETDAPVQSGSFQSDSTVVESAPKPRSNIHDMCAEEEMVQGPENGNVPFLVTDQVVELSVETEAGEKGRNPRTLFYQYMVSFGGHMRAMFALAVCFAGQVGLFSINLWLSMWVNQYQNMEVVDTGFYLSVYGGLIFLSSMIFAISTVSMRWGAWTAAHTMHGRLTKSIFAAPLSWFTANPSGQVINRFAKDIMSMDRDLTLPLQGTIERALALCLRIGVMGSIMPIFVLPAAMMCVLGFFIGEVYTNAQLAVKRLDSAAYSPVFNLFTETLNALPIIRCHRKEHVFSLVLTRRLRLYARTQFTQFNLNRWVAVRTDVAAASVGFMAGLLALYKAKDISASLVGLSLTSAIGLSGTVLQLVRSSNELEVSLNSFQRLLEYRTLPTEECELRSLLQENPALSSFLVEQSLPARAPGRDSDDLLDFEVDARIPVIEFRDVTIKHTLDGPNVLQGLSFKIFEGERVAVVGRTGAGKSSIALSILGFTHIVKGQILINGIDTSTISLESLRAAVTYIPQDLTMFHGSMKENLDMTGEVPPEKLARALRVMQAFDCVLGGNSTGSLRETTFETNVSQNGVNLGQGQRQIVGVGRAIARGLNLVITDEAMSSVDAKTNRQIQAAMCREVLGCTLLSITHRIDTILDHDKVIVLEWKRIVEFGSPKSLFLARNNFCLMVQRSDDQEHTLEKYIMNL